VREQLEFETEEFRHCFTANERVEQKLLLTLQWRNQFDQALMLREKRSRQILGHEVSCGLSIKRQARLGWIACVHARRCFFVRETGEEVKHRVIGKYVGRFLIRCQVAAFVSGDRSDMAWSRSRVTLLVLMQGR
jgi:hypothetical protein